MAKKWTHRAESPVTNASRMKRWLHDTGSDAIDIAHIADWSRKEPRMRGSWLEPEIAAGVPRPHKATTSPPDLNKYLPPGIRNRVPLEG
jgi:hypothetical protein